MIKNLVSKSEHRAFTSGKESSWSFPLLQCLDLSFGQADRLSDRDVLDPCVSHLAALTYPQDHKLVQKEVKICLGQNGVNRFED